MELPGKSGARILALSVALFAGGCAPAPKTGSPAPRAAHSLDAVLPSGRNLFLFDFVQGRYQRWNAETSCGSADSLAARLHDRSRWLSYGSPGTPFSPLAAAAGPNGHFFLLDRLGRRLALYDTNAQYLSSFPLPPELKDRSPERLEVHWTRDGLFTFLDFGEGIAWQFAETRLQGSQGDWRLLNRIRLPVKLETCLWEPFLRSPCCLVRGAAGKPAESRCFDRYFNPRSAPEPAAAGMDSTGGLGASWSARAFPAVEGGGWEIRLRGLGACAEPASNTEALCFRTGDGSLKACEASPRGGTSAP